jgi:predicted site-specific integrase-resolvase
MDKPPVQSGTPEFLTTTQFARQLGVSAATIKRQCAKGLVAHIVISERGDRRIPRTEIDRIRIEAESNRRSRSPW